ncbi:hypothetical protein [Bradyrhizobium roseum]|uniref:hypothetical protein n=1 Tax=Bradyrhizobium roseum TaxID=3056648 RepID=UPI00261A2CD0|nr:hypothetical protein [Bradyrhizobium roseus]WKA29038.1 hypothetical protein QUH67_02205 [Bradyrhizobium roseus]
MAASLQRLELLPPVLGKNETRVTRSLGGLLSCESAQYRISAANRGAVCPAQCIGPVQQPPTDAPMISNLAGYRAPRGCRHEAFKLSHSSLAARALRIDLLQAPVKFRLWH